MWIIFYGWGEANKYYNLYQNVSCGICGRPSVCAQVVMHYHYFSLFFIKIFKWNKKYYLQCPYCGSITEIEKSYFLKLKKGEIDASPRLQPAGGSANPEEDPFGGEFSPSAGAVRENGVQPAQQASAPSVSPVVSEQPGGEFVKAEETGASGTTETENSVKSL